MKTQCTQRGLDGFCVEGGSRIRTRASPKRGRLLRGFLELRGRSRLNIADADLENATMKQLVREEGASTEKFTWRGRTGSVGRGRPSRPRLARKASLRGEVPWTRKVQWSGKAVAARKAEQRAQVPELGGGIVVRKACDVGHACI